MVHGKQPRRAVLADELGTKDSTCVEFPGCGVGLERRVMVVYAFRPRSLESWDW